MKQKTEVSWQQDLIDTCKSLGGFGDKIQDKYVKGKADFWLKLPSGLFLWAEMKIVRRVVWQIRPEFKPLQHDYLGDLAANDIPAIGIIIAITPKEDCYYRIASYFELDDMLNRNNGISFTLNDFTQFYELSDIIAGLEVFFEDSEPQKYKYNPAYKQLKLYNELADDTVDIRT